MGTTASATGALLVAVVVVTALSCDAPSSASAPTPESLLRSALEYLKSLSSAKVEVAISMQVKAEGQDQTLNSTATIRFQRPDKFALVSDSGMLGITFVSDGKQAVTFLPMTNQYMIAEVGDDASTGDLPAGNFAKLANSFDADTAFGEIMKRVTSSRYVGREQVDGVDCHHCRFDTEEITIDVWFEVGNRPLVRKIVPDLTKFLAARAGPEYADQTMRMQWVVTFNSWDTDAQLTDADFAFTPPAGAEQVDTLTGSGGRGMSREPHPLVGQPAPPFDIPDLEGNTVSLASYLGKNVVVLDFWATWCGPCVAALPELNAVANSLKDRGVVFYAVDIGEEKQAVVDFLKEQKLDVPVALDLKSIVAASYRVSGIPQTVLIGKDGKIQVVHVGFGGNMKDELTDELEQLLDGKDLASVADADAAEAKAVRTE